MVQAVALRSANVPVRARVDEARIVQVQDSARHDALKDVEDGVIVRPNVIPVEAVVFTRGIRRGQRLSGRREISPTAALMAWVRVAPHEQCVSPFELARQHICVVEVPALWEDDVRARSAHNHVSLSQLLCPGGDPVSADGRGVPTCRLLIAAAHSPGRVDEPTGWKASESAS